MLIRSLYEVEAIMKQASINMCFTNGSWVLKPQQSWIGCINFLTVPKFRITYIFPFELGKANLLRPTACEELLAFNLQDLIFCQESGVWSFTDTSIICYQQDIECYLCVFLHFTSATRWRIWGAYHLTLSTCSTVTSQQWPDNSQILKLSKVLFWDACDELNI